MSDWHGLARQILERLVESRDRVTIDDLKAEAASLELPAPASHNCWGTVFLRALQDGRIEKIGYVSFELGDGTHTLQVYRLLDQPPTPDSPGFFLPFTDATSGEDTYPGGRYVELDGPEGGPYVLDFNRAHNPYCAYGAPERFACPVTPPANRLEIPIEVGECDG